MSRVDETPVNGFTSEHRLLSKIRVPGRRFSTPSAHEIAITYRTAKTHLDEEDHLLPDRERAEVDAGETADGHRAD
jgi:hypothetical protein